MEVNEKIIEEYLKLVKGWFYMSDVLFPVPNGYSNIDLMAYDPIKDLYYDMEIKYRSAKGIENRELEDHIFQMTRNERNNYIKKIIGHNIKPVKVFVTTKKYFGKSNKNEKKLIEEMKKNEYILEV